MAGGKKGRKAVCGGIRTYAWTSARSHAHHLIHYATASLDGRSCTVASRRGVSDGRVKAISGGHSVAPEGLQTEAAAALRDYSLLHQRLPGGSWWR
ncbi:hypothetical protein E2C01_028890 [Portunus trituberculatus]|uniref:Uncharacterized protein n=1 Tax=Portunus trituberculatus TaxID=210409 RepID=A0A5B7EQC3_PORTR|nr:hypothetical protein [Portunus trituberculatus]